MVEVNYKPRVNVHSDRTGSVKTQGPNRLFVLHTSEGSEGENSAENLAAYMTTKGDRPSPTRPGGYYGASYQYVTDTDGIIPCTPENVVSYSASGANHDGIHICFPGVARQTRAEWLDPISGNYILQAARLLVDRSGPTGIPLKLVTYEEVKAGAWGVCDHFTITNAYKLSNHTDVGRYFPWDILFQEIQQLTQDETEDPFMDTRVMITYDSGRVYPPAHWAAGSAVTTSCYFNGVDISHVFNGATKDLIKSWGVKEELWPREKLGSFLRSFACSNESPFGAVAPNGESPNWAADEEMDRAWNKAPKYPHSPF